MKIGIDASRAARPKRSGTENYSYYLIREMLRLDSENEYFLYTDTHLSSEIQSLYRPRVTERIVPRQLLWSQRALPKAAKKDQLDVLFVPSHVLPHSYSGKTVLTIHGLEYEQYPLGYSFFARMYLTWSTRYGTKMASRIIAPSNETRDLLVSYYNADEKKIHVIPHGGSVKEIERLHSPLACKSQIPEPYFIFIGDLSAPRKNVETLLKAFKALNKRGYAYKIVLVGEQSEFFNTLLDVLVPEVELRNEIIVTGHVSSEDMLCMLQSASAFILPSKAEGFGMPTLDAAQCGVPVIVSRHGFGLDFFSDSTLLIYNETDIDEIAEKMEIVARGSFERGYIEQKKVEALSFDWERAAKSTLEVFKRVHKSSK